MKDQTNPAAIVRAAADLRMLAHKINGHIESGHEKERGGLADYIKAGSDLIRAKELIGHGQFMQWAKSHVKDSHRAITNYILVAVNRSKLASCANLSEALKVIAGGKVSKNPVPEELVVSRRIESLIAFIDTMAATRGKGTWYPELKPKLEECAKTWQQFSGKVKEAKVELPKSLDTKEFRSEWEEWLQHHREKQSRLTATAIKKQLVTLAEMGPERATKALDYSIRQCYHGIVEPGNGKPQDGSGRNAAAQRRTERRGRDFAEPDAPIPDPLASA